MATQLIAIALGGSAGAILRFLISNGIYGWLGRSFPHGTLFVNVTGSFLMGLLSVLMLQRFPIAVEYRAAILVGFLGAYTTFSTFAIETLSLFETGSLLKAILNIILSIVLCLVAVWIGSILGYHLFASETHPWLGQHFPYRDFWLGLLLIVMLSATAEFLFQRDYVPAAFRAMGLIVLLGLATIASTLWQGLKFSAPALEFDGLLSLFIVNGLFGAVALWLGSSIGQWLNQ